MSTVLKRRRLQFAGHCKEQSTNSTPSGITRKCDGNVAASIPSKDDLSMMMMMMMITIVVMMMMMMMTSSGAGV